MKVRRNRQFPIYLEWLGIEGDDSIGSFGAVKTGVSLSYHA